MEGPKSKLLIFFAFLFVFHLTAQDIETDLSKVDIDDLSDTQIERFIEEVNKRGLSEQQLEILARSRGLTNQQINKLKQRINEVRFEDQETGQTTGDLRLRQRNITEQKEDFDLFDNLASTDTIKEETIFGMSYFKNKNLIFEPSLNIPTPTNYQLGAGDEIVIDIWGASEQTYQLIISPEGSIRIPDVGPVYLSGMTVDRASTRVLNRLTQIYAGLSPGNGEAPNTFAQVSLGQIRSINISVIGEVENPGTYTLSSFSTVFNALYYSGGPNRTGSLRNIDVFRNNKKIKDVDFYDYLIKGRQTQNIRLRDQDIIIVHPYDKRVSVKGNVKRPAIYEFVDKENVNNLLEYAGGFSENAYQDQITIRRSGDLFKKIVSVERKDYSDTPLKNGDEVLISTILDRFENKVTLQGAVQKAGDYEFKPELTLSALIKKGEGLRDDAFEGRGLILRTNKDYSLVNIPFSVSEVIKGQSDVDLRPDDIVRIFSRFDLREDYFITVEGEVNEPGKILYVDSMTVEDAILQAGGFRESAIKSQVELSRRIRNENIDANIESQVYNFSIDDNLDISDKASEMVLQPFDLVIVRKSPHFKEQKIVEVEGEVNQPGKYVLQKKNERIAEILVRAGGLTDFAYIEGASLIRKTEFAKKENSDDQTETTTAAQIKQDELQDLASRDSSIQRQDINFKTEESVGIDLGRVMDDPGSKYDLILQDGDVLSIPRNIETVRLRGQLLRPSKVRYDPNLSFRDYISLAGGFASDARKGKAFVIYPNGSASQTNKFLWFNFYPKIKPGSEIIIPQKPERNRLSAQEIIGLTTAITSFGLLVDRLLQ